MKSSDIGVFQICFSNEHVLSLQDGAMLWDNRENPHPEQREFFIFNQIYSKKIFRQFQLTGAMSSKFPQKTNRSISDFKHWVESNPGYDLYLINPFPRIPLMYKSIWEHGEECHPGIIEQVEHIFESALGIKIDLSVSPHVDHGLWSFCNFWVGSVGFWETYLPVLNKVFEFCQSDKRFGYYSDAPHDAPAPMFSFIVERLLTTVLTMKSEFPEFGKFKVKSYSYDISEYERQCYTVEELEKYRAFLAESAHR